MSDGEIERFARRDVLKVADVLREEELVAAGGGGGVFEKRPQGEHVRRFLHLRDLHRLGRYAAGAAHPEDPGIHDARHGIVAAHEDLSVVHEEALGDAPEARERLVVADHEGLAPGIGARHHEERLLRGFHPGGSLGFAREGVKEQRMQGRIGEHHAHLGESRRNAGQGRGRLRGLFFGAPQRRRLAAEHDRVGGGEEKRLLVLRDLHPPARGGDAGAHDGKGFFVAALPLAQALHGRGISCVADEVETPDALQGDDFAAPQGRSRFTHRVARERAARRVRPRELRAADGAGVGLRVEAPVGGVLVLGEARRAHGENRHRGLRTVVGEAPRDREARSAVGAVREGVAVPAVRRVEDVRKAGAAGRGVRGDHRRDGAGVLGRCNSEGREALHLRRKGRDRVDAGERGLFAQKFVGEGGERRRVPFEVHAHALRVVVDLAREAERDGDAPDRGAEPHALDESLDADELGCGRHKTVLPRLLLMVRDPDGP